MTRAELLVFHNEFSLKMFNICKAKNADYAGLGGDDPFANFRRVESMGICSAEQGFLVRMTDKMSRLASLIDGTTPAVKEESVEDTLLDLANYAILLSAYRKSKAGNP